ncbi:MAG: hypothetical protein CL833_14670 [Crocinitomicaceae bacterium]|nr:hypothetical protein [Crocinitomicaceae bacterium]
MWRSLTFRIWLPFTLSVFIIAAIVAFLRIQSQTDLLLSNNQARIENVAKTVALGVELNFTTGDETKSLEGIQKSIDWAGSSNEVDYIAIRSSEDYVNDPLFIERRFSEIETNPIEDQKNFSIGEAEFKSDIFRGKIIVASKNDRITDQIWEGNVQIFIVLASVFAVLSIAFYVLANMISSPLKDLKNKTEGLKNNEYGKVEVSSNSSIKEVESLANSIDELSDSLQKEKENNEMLLDNLERSLNKEKHIGELKSHFVSMASHQFRTPLAIIQSNSELLAMIVNNGKAESQKEKLIKTSTRIGKEISRMTQLMDDVLILGKIGSGHLQAEPKELDLVELVSEIQTHTSSIQPDGRQLEMEIEGNAVKALLDEKLVQHVIENLVSNAFKYSKEKNPKLKLTFRQKTISISVEDNGIGIPENEIDNLFQPFHRAYNVEDISGTGLGLAIAKEYTDLNGGHIRVESKENEGAKFTVTFPLSVENRKEKMQEQMEAS